MTSVAAKAAWPDYAAIWRWHFYAGLLCIPFVIWLACTGSIYLFRTEIDALSEAPYERLAITAATPPSAQVEAALAAHPGARFHAYELPRTPHSASRVMLRRDDVVTRVYVHPQTLQILHSVRDDHRFTRMIFYLHGELLMGERGSLIVELAACWAIVMIITGLCLWWPRGQSGLGGIIYPRPGRFFLRDLHAVVGLWVSFFAFFLILTGLPWANVWGSYLREVRTITHQLDGPQDWTTSRAREQASIRALDQHAEHAPPAPPHPHGDLAALDRIAPTIAALRLPPPVLISPPRGAGPWTAKSDTPNRPQRVDFTLDGETGAVLTRRDFNQRHWIDRIVGTGVAAHEGRLFGPLNQALGVFAALGLVTLAISGAMMWLKRRPANALGAPERRVPPRFGWSIVTLVVLLGVLFPVLGASIVIVALTEWLVLRRIPPVRDWLGLAA